ncbi:MAG: acetyl-CoA hydrolase, partial [Proteobacteria bacterium]|nr:acetyl-CoA hydrolase [Pseudomonadota bacterium]
NVVWKYSYCTIPRHLRDVVVTEYGIADLRGKTDEECIKRMICIADSRFQAELRSTAIKYNKLDANWQIPDAFCSNTAEHLKQNFQTASSAGYFPEYPFTCDFTEQELAIISALKFLKANTRNKAQTIKTIFSALLFARKTPDTEGFLKRMDLIQTNSFKEKLAQKLLLFGLQKS